MIVCCGGCLHACVRVCVGVWWCFVGVVFGCGERVWPVVFMLCCVGCGLGVRVLRVACCRVLGQCALVPGFLLILGPLLLLFTVVVGLGLGGVGGLVVNCIVGVSIFVLCVLLWFVFLSVWWMPWHQGPMKDVVVCDKPRGAG